MWNLVGVVVIQRSIVNWRRAWGSVYTGICVFFYMWNLFSVVVFHRSMVDWRKGWGLSALVSVHSSICDTYSVYWFSRDLWSIGGGGGVCLHTYLYILLYVILIQCSGLPEIYGQLEVVGSVCTGICAFCYMWNLLGVVVFHRSIVNWRREVGSAYTGICEFFYTWYLFGVVVFLRSMVNWRRGWGLSALYLYILLYVKLIQCSGLPEIYGWLEEGVGSVYTGNCVFFYMWYLFSVVVFLRSMVDWRRGWGLSVLVSVHSSICES